MEHKLFKRIFIISLILMMSLSLCACNKTNIDKDTKENKVVSISSSDSEQTNKSNDSSDSLIKLRENLKNIDANCAVEYLGYLGGLFENSYEEEFPKWLKENNQEILEEYPFIFDIDENHIINKAGYLYCIVPKDENATLAINSVKWNEETQSEEIINVLYRQETGEPILLFCNYDEITYEPDVVMYITDNSGNSCKSYPLADQRSKLVSCLSDDEACKWINFSSIVPYETDDFDNLDDEEWSKISSTDLAGYHELGLVWVAEKTANYEIRFFPDEENSGRVTLTRYNDKRDSEEEWSGFWTLDDENLSLELTFVGGQSYDDYDGPRYISDTYSVLKNKYGTKISIALGENNVRLPFLSENNSICILKQKAG